MYAWGDNELPEEEVSRVLKVIADRIHAYKIEAIAIITLETVKPLSNLGAELSRLFFSPILPALGPEYNLLGEKMIYIFQNRKNIEKLIDLIEEKSKKKETSTKEGSDKTN